LIGALGIDHAAEPTDTYLVVKAEIRNLYVALFVSPENLYVLAEAETFFTDFQEPLDAVI
jgi:hypothetical protein